MGYKPEGFIQHVFGDNIGIADMTDIMAKNVIELAKRQKMTRAGDLTGEDVGYPGLSVEAVNVALEQDCLELSKLGQKWQDAETIKGDK
jgi:hypothetical protein